MTVPRHVMAVPGAMWRLSMTLRRGLLLAPPLALAVLEIMHPQPEQTVQALLDEANWFLAFHFIQLPAQQEGVFNAVQSWPGLEPLAFLLSIVGTLGWVVAVGGLAVAARRAGARRGQWILTALAAFFLLGGHPAPAGALACGCLFIAALLNERRLTQLEPVGTGAA